MKKLLLFIGCFVIPLSSHAAGDPLRKIARDFGKKIQPLKKPRVGLLSFPYHNGKTSSGSSILSERLTTYMAEIRGVRVIERALLKKLLEEQHLSETGVLDASAAQKLGKVLGVDVIVTGTLIDLEDNTTELNARALNAGTGEVLAAGRAVITRTWSDRPRSPRERTASSSSRPTDQEERPAENEAIEVGYPGGGPGRAGGGGFGKR